MVKYTSMMLLSTQDQGQVLGFVNHEVVTVILRTFFFFFSVEIKHDYIWKKKGLYFLGSVTLWAIPLFWQNYFNVWLQDWIDEERKENVASSFP